MAGTGDSGVVQLFIKLANINSPSKGEGEISVYLTELLRELGAEVWRDNSGEFIGGQCGNILAALPGSGSLADEEPVMLIAHMDTVQPTEGISIVRDSSYIRTDGTTILGADDKAGISVIIEALRESISYGRDRRPIEIIFTVAEEIGLYGAKYVDLSRFRAREAVALDSGSPVGTVVTRSPAQDELKVVFIGRAAHAGVEPEKGINAIKAAAKAIADMELGRIDPETTANIGVISGGVATNIVPESVIVKGEARSRDERKLLRVITSMQESCLRAAGKIGAQIDMKVDRSFAAMDISEDNPLVVRLRDSAKAVGVEFKTESRGGGSDANVLNGRGLTAVNLGLGMEQEHSGDERIEIDSLVKGVALLTEFLSR